MVDQEICCKFVEYSSHDNSQVRFACDTAN